MMPRSATIPDLHHASDTKAVLSVREKLLAKNYLFSVALFAVLLKYFLCYFNQAITQSATRKINYLLLNRNVESSKMEFLISWLQNIQFYWTLGPNIHCIIYLYFEETFCLQTFSERSKRKHEFDSKYEGIMSLRNLYGYLPVDNLDYHRIIRSSIYIFLFF
jgi:hypothetical protein